MCNCGRGRSSTVNRSASQRSIPGFSSANPVVFGSAEGEIIEVRVMRPIAGLRLMQRAWVQGTGVPELISNGTFVNETGSQRTASIWKVGGNTFFDYSDAERVSIAEGLPIVEVM